MLFSLPLLFLLFLFLISSPLEARGSGEFSSAYQETLLASFEESVLKIESGEWTVEQAKSDLSDLRDKYRVEYNDFAGQIDAILDGVAEKRIGTRTALDTLIQLQTASIDKRNQTLKEQEEIKQRIRDLENQKNQNSSESAEPGTSGDGGSSGKKR